MTRGSHLGLTLAAALALLLSAPTVTAQDAHFDSITVNLHPERFDAILLGDEFEGADARALRTAIDEDHGNADGTVTEDEVELFVGTEMSELNEQLRLFSSLTNKIRVHDRPPLETKVTDIALSANIIGDANDNSTVIRDVYALLTYADTQSDSAPVSFAQDFRHALPTMKWDYALFVPVDPWAVVSKTIEPGGNDNPFWDGAQFNVTYDQMGEFSSGFTPLTFDLEDQRSSSSSKKKKSPGVPAIILTVAVLGLLALTRRDQ